MPVPRRGPGFPFSPALALAILLAASGHAQVPGERVRFERLTLGAGPARSAVTAIAQDRAGFLWFGTREGLHRYDGYGFRVFRGDPARTSALSSSSITRLFLDSLGRLWIGTEAGLNRLDPGASAFVRFLSGEEAPSGPGGNTVTALAEDRRGRIWIGTPRGLIMFDPHAGRFVIHLRRPGDPRSLGDNRVSSLHIDRGGALWVGTLGGLNRMETMSGICLRIEHRDDDPGSLNSNTVLVIHEDRAGRLWVGTDACLDLLLAPPTSEKPAVFAHVRRNAGDGGIPEREVVRDICDGDRGELWIATGSGGLCRLVWRGTGSPLPSLERFRHDPADPESLSRDALLCLALDGGGTLWAGTDGGGANKVDPERARFRIVRSDPADPWSAARGRVTAIAEDASGALWIGTERGLLRPAGASPGRSDVGRVPDGLPADLATARISALVGESSGDLWIATRGAGLVQWQPHSGRVVRYRSSSTDPASAGDDDLTALLIDRRRDIWAGTAAGGVFRIPRKEAGEPGPRKVRFRAGGADGDPAGLPSNEITAMTEDREGRIWIGTVAGLCALRAGPAGAKHPFDRFLEGIHVLAVRDDEAGRIWVGTHGTGLLRLDKKSGESEPYGEARGFPQTSVMGILIDDRGRVWLGTNEGLACLDPAAETFRHFAADDGLPANVFVPGAALRGSNGRLHFGTREGLASFQPNELIPGGRVPAVVLTGISRDGRMAPIPETGPDGRAKELPTIETRPGESLTLAFSALDFAQSDRNEYAYRLEPVRPDWTWLGRERDLTFAGLAPGLYTLTVRGSNGDGIWNTEGTTLRLRVRAPLLRSAGFLVPAFALLGATGALLFRRAWARRRMGRTAPRPD
jgi:ligand-binding sensor domain-containing protein